jgi:hypothetical protein
MGHLSSINKAGIVLIAGVLRQPSRFAIFDGASGESAWRVGQLFFRGGLLYLFTIQEDIE